MSNPTDPPPESPPDLAALAGRYLALWQKQVSAMAADPTLAAALSKTVAFVTEAAERVNAGAPD
ncbi:hypothetical protein CKO10_14410, partial [Rhodospirillum rubrum]|nr:hypothetical protein [Rhodospirillum rubrum]